MGGLILYCSSASVSSFLMKFSCCLVYCSTFGRYVLLIQLPLTDPLYVVILKIVLYLDTVFGVSLFVFITSFLCKYSKRALLLASMKKRQILECALDKFNLASFFQLRNFLNDLYTAYYSCQILFLVEALFFKHVSCLL